VRDGLQRRFDALLLHRFNSDGKLSDDMGLGSVLRKK
jgi:hypothetical protein